MWIREFDWLYYRFLSADSQQLRISAHCASRLNPKPRLNDRNKPTQDIAKLLGATCCVRLATKRSQHANATYPCCDMLGGVGSNLNIFKFEPTTPNMLQHGGQTHATCCAQQCCDMLRWHVVIWPGLMYHNKTVLFYALLDILFFLCNETTVNLY